MRENNPDVLILLRGRSLIYDKMLTNNNSLNMHETGLGQVRKKYPSNNHFVHCLSVYYYTDIAIIDKPCRYGALTNFVYVFCI